MAETRGDASEATAGGIVPQCDRLFPFPLQFCSNLNLLNAFALDVDIPDDAMIDLLAFENSLIDWSVDGFIDFDGPSVTDSHQLP
jgi:hypothetical protein